MKEKDFLSKILSEHSAPQKPSLSEQYKSLLNVPKEPSLVDQLIGIKNHKPTRPISDDKEYSKEQMKEEPKNPKYTLTNKNFVRLVDKAEEHGSKIEMLCFKVANMEESQAHMQAEISQINNFIKSQEKDQKQKVYGIEWKSFAYGAIVLACLWFAIHRLT